MTPRTGPGRDRAKQHGIAWLAGAGMWLALGAAVVLAPGPPGWARVTFAFCMGLTAVSFIAVYRRRSGQGGNGLRVRGRDGDDGPYGETSHRWHTLAVVSRLLLASAGRRWLAEAESLLAEVAPSRRGTAVRSYLLSAPRLAAMMWALELLRRLRPGPRRPG